jgi:3,4-dihydroxy 2-butanone 4-phosphate synthase/GTP cyclohydrolase II
MTNDTILSEALRPLIIRDGLSPAGLARAAGVGSACVSALLDHGREPDPESAAKLWRYLRHRESGLALATPEEIINEARNGRMFILVDDEDRENEGDLVIPAQMATPTAISFMATHGRGLICLALTRERVEQLGLKPMSAANGTRHETAFTVSIEAREGVTTGISAADRARTIAVAIDAGRGQESIVTPGHVFPLTARPGGVLVRAGHTEAAVDVSRLAGLNPSGVICEIMNDDGTMARLDDLVPFATKHSLKIATIRDLIAYRRRNDHLVEKRSEAIFDSAWGAGWKAMAFRNRATGTEQVVLQKGEIDPEKPTLVRVHLLAPLSDLFGRLGIRHGVLQRAMEIIDAEGAGIIVVLSLISESGYSPMFDVMMGIKPHSEGPIDELRDYGVGAQILAELGVHDMILLTNSRQSLVALDGYGLSVVGQRSLER